MPTTEVPTPPSQTPEPPVFQRKRSRYEDLEADELLHLIDRLEDERSRARLREGIYVSLLAHVVFFLLWFFGPKYILHRPTVISPAEVLRQRQKDFTYLDLPPDALKHLKPKNPQALSDKDRVAQSQHPTLDRKTLQQLQAMRRAGPPVPQRQAPPAPQPGQGGAPNPPQQQAQAAPAAPAPQSPAPATQPLQTQQQATEEAPAPKPQPRNPDFNTSSSAGDAIRQAARAAAQGGGQSSGDFGAGVAPHHPGLNAGVDILSDTLGVDFGPYMQRVIAATYRAWLPIIPESARPPLLKQGKVGIEFKIMPDGSVKQMILRFPSGDVALDRAAWGGITGASPYPPLPKEFKGPYLALRFGFYYNAKDELQ